jgi:hypothetical protein
MEILFSSKELKMECQHLLVQMMRTHVPFCVNVSTYTLDKTHGCVFYNADTGKV